MIQHTFREAERSKWKRNAKKSTTRTFAAIVRDLYKLADSMKVRQSESEIFLAPVLESGIFP